MDEQRVYKSQHCFARIAPRKARLVIDLIRGMNCEDAMSQLRFNRKRAAVMVAKVLKSAMANADEHEADMGRLFVTRAWVDGGPYYRRWRPKDRGRAHPIAKKTSHLNVVLAERS